MHLSYRLRLAAVEGHVKGLEVESGLERHAV